MMSSRQQLKIEMVKKVVVTTDRSKVVPVLQLFFVCVLVVANVPLCLNIARSSSLFFFFGSLGRLCFVVFKMGATFTGKKFLPRSKFFP